MKITKDISAIIKRIDSIQGQSAGEKNLLSEIHVRLINLKSQYLSLMVLNDEYLTTCSTNFSVAFDSEIDTLTIQTPHKKTHLKLNRANANIPIQLKSESDMHAFSLNKDSDNKSGDSFRIKSQIAIELECFYFNAAKLWKLIENDLLKKKRTTFIGILLVRNKLIEHAEKFDIFSFGASRKLGPTVKPLHSGSNIEKWHDAGLKKNTTELVQMIHSRLRSL